MPSQMLEQRLVWVHQIAQTHGIRITHDDSAEAEYPSAIKLALGRRVTRTATQHPVRCQVASQITVPVIPTGSRCPYCSSLAPPQRQEDASPRAASAVMLVGHLNREGEWMYQARDRFAALEGIVAKRLDSVYLPGHLRTNPQTSQRPTDTGHIAITTNPIQ
jgi:hypothetical protein